MYRKAEFLAWVCVFFLTSYVKCLINFSFLCISNTNTPIQPLKFTWKQLNRTHTHACHPKHSFLDDIEIPEQLKSVDRPTGNALLNEGGAGKKSCKTLSTHIACLFVKTTKIRPCTHTCLDKIPPNTPAHLQYYYNTRRSVEKEPDYIMHLTTSHYNKEQVSSRTPRHLSTSTGWHAWIWSISNLFTSFDLLGLLRDCFSASSWTVVHNIKTEIPLTLAHATA